MQRKGRARAMRKDPIRPTTISLAPEDIERLTHIAGFSTTDKIRRAIRVAHYIARCLEEASSDEKVKLDLRAIRDML